jgi:hypothetical protein
MIPTTVYQHSIFVVRSSDALHFIERGGDLRGLKSITSVPSQRGCKTMQVNDNSIAEPNHDHGTAAEAYSDIGAPYVQSGPAANAGGHKSRKLEDMARPTWLSILTQHGSKPPFMLKVRSSDAFIIGTVSLAVFTVRTLYPASYPHGLIKEGHVPIRCHSTCHPLRHTST